MARRRVAKLKYFNGETELENVRMLRIDLFGLTEPPFKVLDHNGREFGYPSLDGKLLYRLFGLRPATKNVFHTPEGGLKSQTEWDYYRQFDMYRPQDWLPVDRTVRYLDKPDPHQCDSRCLGAKPGGECWCSCRGRNHGRNFRCD